MGLSLSSSPAAAVPLEEREKTNYMLFRFIRGKGVVHPKIKTTFFFLHVILFITLDCFDNEFWLLGCLHLKKLNVSFRKS